jgi:3-deoxy-D-manno-octulosonic-acid transferase
MSAHMALFFYSLMTRWLQPWVRRKLHRRAVREPLYGEHIEQRFGRYDTPVQAMPLWIHAVSLGETRAAGILLAELRRLRPDLQVLLTHGTATGLAQGKSLLQPGDAQAWLPWDTPEAVAGFLDHFQPRAGLLMETEVWPNLVRGCVDRGIPLVLANARLSEKSLRQALRLGFWARPAYQALTAVWPQTEADAQRFARLGVGNLRTLGNLKYDVRPDPHQVDRGQSLRGRLGRPVALLASSREGEEAAWIDAWPRDAAALPWVVPRHPQRFQAVVDLLRERGWHVVRASQMSWTDSDLQRCQQAGVVVVGDTLGEMAFYYALVGGSFEPYGGQNLIEALACACPVVLGPHTFNFEQASAEAMACGAAWRADTMAQGVQMGLELCRDRARRAQMSAQGLNLLAQHRGVAQEMAQAVLQALDGGFTSARR